MPIFFLAHDLNPVGSEQGCLRNSVSIPCLSIKEGVAEVSLLVIFPINAWWDASDLPHDCQVFIYKFLPLLSQFLMSQNGFLRLPEDLPYGLEVEVGVEKRALQ